MWIFLHWFIEKMSQLKYRCMKWCWSKTFHRTITQLCTCMWYVQKKSATFPTPLWQTIGTFNSKMGKIIPSSLIYKRGLVPKSLTPWWCCIGSEQTILATKGPNCNTNIGRIFSEVIGKKALWIVSYTHLFLMSALTSSYLLLTLSSMFCTFSASSWGQRTFTSCPVLFMSSIRGLWSSM